MPHPTPHAMSLDRHDWWVCKFLGSMPHPTPHPIDLPATSAGPIANKLNNQIVHAQDLFASPSSAASADCAQLSGGQACSCSGASCTGGCKTDHPQWVGASLIARLVEVTAECTLGYTLSGGQPAFPSQLGTYTPGVSNTDGAGCSTPSNCSVQYTFKPANNAASTTPNATPGSPGGNIISASGFAIGRGPSDYDPGPITLLDPCGASY